MTTASMAMHTLRRILWQAWNKRQRTKGRKKYRKGLEEAFSFLGEADIFIVNERTRFYRNPSALCKLDIYCLSNLKENNVALVEAETGKIDHINNEIDIAVQKLLATYEMKKLEERKEASRQVIQKNKINGITFSNAFGTIWNKESKTLSFDPRKVQVVQYIFDSIIQHKTYAEILYNLNKKYLHLAIGKCFYESSINNMCKNISYCGMRYADDGSIIQCKNVVNPPISYLKFLDTNNIVNIKKNKSGRQKYNLRDHAKRHFLPLSGLLKCGNCGSKIVMVNDGNRLFLQENGYSARQELHIKPNSH